MKKRWLTSLRGAQLLSVKDECINHVASLPALYFKRLVIFEHFAHIGNSDLLFGG